MINCKTCRNTKNCVYAGADREMEECVDRIPTTHSDIIRSMTDEELADLLSGGEPYPWCEQDPCPAETCQECIMLWLNQEVKE